MEEPLLSAIVANEPEPSIPHQPLDDPVRHVDNLRGPCRTTLRREESKFCSMRLSEPPLPRRRLGLELACSGLEREHIRGDGLGEFAISGEHD